MAGGIPGAVVAGSSALANLAGGWFSSSSQKKINESNQQFAEKMYAQQKADNLDFWNMQNAYNSPEQQMQRYTAAGLNPNLIYGNGAGSSNAGSIATPTYHMPEKQAANPLQNLGRAVDSGIQTYQNIQMQKLQADNLKVQNQNMLNDGILKSLAAENAKLDITKKGALLPTQLDAAMLQNNATIMKMADQSAGIDLKNAQIGKLNQDTKNAVTSGMILRNQYELLNATKGMTVKQAALKVIQMELNNQKTKAETQNIGVRTNNAYQEHETNNLRQEQLIEMTNKMRDDRNNNRQENDRRGDKNDRDWLQAIKGYINDFL